MVSGVVKHVGLLTLPGLVEVSKVTDNTVHRIVQTYSEKNTCRRYAAL
jgi:hypothetical protein